MPIQVLYHYSTTTKWVSHYNVSCHVFLPHLQNDFLDNIFCFSFIGCWVSSIPSLVVGFQVVIDLWIRVCINYASLVSFRNFFYYPYSGTSNGMQRHKIRNILQSAIHLFWIWSSKTVMFPERKKCMSTARWCW